MLTKGELEWLGYIGDLERDNHVLTKKVKELEGRLDTARIQSGIAF